MPHRTHARSLALPLRLLGGSLVCAVFAALSPLSAGAALTLPGAPGIRVFSSADVLSERVQTLPSGDLLFRDAAGARIRLITSTDDPEISNPGNGSFHPADPTAVFAALSAIPPAFLASLQMEIYLLPYPRSGMLSSSADSRAIYLTPGVLPYDAQQIHFLVAHEIGHAVHRALLPDSNAAGWAEWAALRGVADTNAYNERAPHADRPHEIFAEDFRVLFGGPIARGDGSIENRSVRLPEDVPGLQAFYESLAGIRSEIFAAGWRLYPNPVRLGDVLTLRAPSGWSANGAPNGATSAGTSGGTGLLATLFDAAGRHAGELHWTASAPGEWSAHTSASDLRSLSSGVYWLRMGGDAAGLVPSALPVRILQ